MKEEPEKLDEATKIALPKLRDELGQRKVTLAKMIELAESKHDRAKIREIELGMRDRRPLGRLCRGKRDGAPQES